MQQEQQEWLRWNQLHQEHQMGAQHRQMECMARVDHVVRWE